MNLTDHEMYDRQKVMGLLKNTISDWYYNKSLKLYLVIFHGFEWSIDFL